MKESKARTRWTAGITLGLLLSGTLLVLVLYHNPKAKQMAPASPPEQLVFFRSTGDIADADPTCILLTNTTDPIAIKMNDGRDVSFQSAIYIRIGRAQVNY